MINKSVDEAVFNAILSKAFRDAAIADMQEERNNKESTSVELTPAHLRIERRAYKRYEAQRKHHNNIWYSAFQRAVMCVLMLGTLGFVSLVAIPPVRATVIDVVIEFFDKYTSFNFVKTSDENSIIIDDYKMKYVPDGYELTDENVTRLSAEYIFTDKISGNSFSVKYMPADSTNINFDSEYSKYSIVSVNDYIAYLFEFEFNSTIKLLYTDGNNVIVISGCITKDEILSIAKNIS